MSENIKYLDDENFKSSIVKGVTLVDFYADWCGPCKMIAPLISELSDELKGKAFVAKVDVDTAQKIASEYDITSIPTLIIFKDGVEAKRIVGIRDKNSLKTMVLEAL
ncbi:MAG: thioredoxin [Parachlamydiaceae bacterium]|nr:thioredoxin [Parachlamydiaceae bacterium]